MATAAGGSRKLTNYLGGRLGIYGAIIVALIIANAAAQNTSLLQVSFWALALLLVLVPFDGSRFLASRKPPPGGMLPPTDSKFPTLETALQSVSATIVTEQGQQPESI